MAELDFPSEDDFYLFLERTGWMDAKCEVCGSTALAMRSTKSDPILLSVPQLNLGDGGSQFYSMICIGCGNTKLLDKGFVHMKLKEFKENGG